MECVLPVTAVVKECASATLPGYIKKLDQPCSTGLVAVSGNGMFRVGKKPFCLSPPTKVQFLRGLSRLCHGPTPAFK